MLQTAINNYYFWIINSKKSPDANKTCQLLSLQKWILHILFKRMIMCKNFRFTDTLFRILHIALQFKIVQKKTWPMVVYSSFKVILSLTNVYQLWLKCILLYCVCSLTFKWKIINIYSNGQNTYYLTNKIENKHLFQLS